MAAAAAVDNMPRARYARPTDRAAAFSYLEDCTSRGEIVTGLLFIDDTQGDMHDIAHTVDEPLTELDYEALCPGANALQELQESFK